MDTLQVAKYLINKRKLMLGKSSAMQINEKPRKIPRGLFWVYCQRAANAAVDRSRRRGQPCDIDGYTIDELLVDQEWCCAVSGIELTAPTAKARDPFGPSLDRIVPSLGYVQGNVRIVCNIVNFAMNEWGLESLIKLVVAMSTERDR